MTAASSYLHWLVEQTPTRWWHDSGDPTELTLGLEHGACGVTTNPVLTSQALAAQPDHWCAATTSIDPHLTGDAKVEALMYAVARETASRLEAHYNSSQGSQGYVCAQVSPQKASDRVAMLEMARRFHTWAPNIAVKLPVTAAGLDVLEDCTAEGITVTATVSFTVPQVVAIAERHRLGIARAQKAGVQPGRCFAVIMIGRLDDYLRDVAQDNQANVSEADIRLAGLAVTKRAVAIYQREAYEAVLLVAALRGTYHMTGLAGAGIIMSIHPSIQKPLLEMQPPFETGIDTPVPQEVISRLQAMPEFVRSYEPDGMAPGEFISFALTQRTLTQFHEAGWGKLAAWSP